MCIRSRLSFVTACLLSVIVVTLTVQTVWSCGGFFCQSVPINQAAEQVIFRQDGNSVTAVVLIQYVGEAEDFSWVVPVDGVPELSTGSDLVFGALELATRPQFALEVTGSSCPNDFPLASGGNAEDADTSNDNASDDGVNILESLTVGPFDVQIVTSDDPDSLATWLDENGYDLTDRGRDLIAPYVDEGKNFVALKLRQDQGVGDIQPLIMRYESGEPCVPIRLTAVAAQPDMGVLVWLLGPSRGIPSNYVHVTPNYTRLNWYSGTFAAYASYQTLITDAMNESGGQGFATDYAGRDVNILDQLPSAATYTSELTYLAGFSNDAEFVAAAANDFVFPNDQILAILQRALPVQPGDEYVWTIDELVESRWDAETLASARAQIINEISTTIIDPLQETLSLFDGDPYVTRFYTTLSADEMTVDPTFAFNAEIPDQPLERRATMNVTCGQGWSLTLGSGTGREGEKVIEGDGNPPGFFLPAPTIEQDASWKIERIATTGAPTVIAEKQFPLAQVGDGGAGNGAVYGCGSGASSGACGNGVAAVLLLSFLGWLGMRRR